MAEARLTAVVSTKGAVKAEKELNEIAKTAKVVDINVKKTGKTFKTFGSNAARAVAAIDGPLGGISSRITAITSLANSGAIAFAGFAAAIVATSFAVIKGVSALDEYDVNLRRVNATIEATGAGVGFTGEQLLKEAENLALATLTSVDAVQKAQAKLLTFNRVLGAEFTQTIKLSQDLAEAGFGSIESNAILLGKALQDPIKGMAALSRVGVTLSETQKQLAQDAIDVGDVFAAQEIILNAVAGQVEGVAAAVADGTLAGAVDTLGQKWDDLSRNVAKNSGALTAWTRIVTGAGIAAGALSEALADDTAGELFNERFEATLKLNDELSKLEGINDKNSNAYNRQAAVVSRLKVEVQSYDDALKSALDTENARVKAAGDAAQKELDARKRIAEEAKAEADARLAIETEREKAKEEKANERAERELERIKKQNQREIDLAKSKEDKISSDKLKLEKLTNKQRKEGFNQTVNDLETVLGRENAIFKAAAVTNATIKTYEAANSAYSAMASIPVVGPGLGIAAAGAAVAAGLVNVRAITSAREQGGNLSAGQPSTVAERGQLEILTPTSSSRIRTKQQMQQLMGEGGSSTPAINIVNIDQSTGGVSVESSVDDDGRIIQLIRDTTALDASNPNSELRKTFAATTTLEARR